MDPRVHYCVAFHGNLLPWVVFGVSHEVILIDDVDWPRNSPYLGYTGICKYRSKQDPTEIKVTGETVTENRLEVG